MSNFDSDRGNSPQHIRLNEPNVGRSIVIEPLDDSAALGTSLTRLHNRIVRFGTATGNVDDGKFKVIRLKLTSTGTKFRDFCDTDVMQERRNRIRIADAILFLNGVLKKANGIVRGERFVYSDLDADTKRKLHRYIDKVTVGITSIMKGVGYIRNTTVIHWKSVFWVVLIVIGVAGLGLVIPGAVAVHGLISSSFAVLLTMGVSWELALFCMATPMSVMAFRRQIHI